MNFEDRFEIQIPRRLRRSDLDAVDPGFSYLLRPKRRPTICLRKESFGLAPQRHRRDYPVRDPIGKPYVFDLGRMKAYGGPNKVVSRFAKMGREEWEASVWEGFHGRPDFVFSSPLVQLFNPHAAKGYALLKPSGTNRNDKTKDRWAEPFLEWLRYRGYFEGAPGGSPRDLRLFCPIPADMHYGQFSERSLPSGISDSVGARSKWTAGLSWV